MSNYEIELQVQGSPSGELTQQVDGEPGGGSVSAREAEAWARGTRAGTAVSSDDPTYHNNSKYYAEQAHDAAESASAAYGTNLLAPTFDASQAYPAGAHVIHDGGYYVLPEGHTAGDTWAETSKTQQTVGGEVTGLKSAVEKKADVIDVTLDTPASVMTFSDGADGMPMAVKVGIEPVQAGTGDPSPENIRPISTRSIIRFAETGKAILGGSDILPMFQIGYPGINHGETALWWNANNGNGKTFIQNIFKPNTRYTLFLDAKVSTGNNGNMNYKYSDGTTASVGNLSSERSLKRFVSSADKSLVGIVGQNSGGSTTLYYENTVIMEGNVSMEEYEKYKGKYQNIALPDNFFGGTLVINKDGTGILTSEWANIASYDGETLPGEWISDRDVYAEGTTPTTGAQVVYKVATPVESSLTVEQVKSILGTNNAFFVNNADGTLSVEQVDYSADTKTYIDNGNAVQDATASATQEMIADSDLPVATENHASGEVFICGNKLYMATATIAEGDTITEGTNVATTITVDSVSLPLNLANYIKYVLNEVGGVATDLNSVKGYTGVDPDAVMTKRALVQNGQITITARSVTIKDGVVTHKTESGANDYRVYLLTKELATERASGGIGFYKPPLTSLETIDKLSGITHMRIEFINNNQELTGTFFVGLMFCSVDSETDEVTVLSRQNLESNKMTGMKEISIPTGTTHFTVYIYQRYTYQCDVSFYLKFMCLTATNN